MSTINWHRIAAIVGITAGLAVVLPLVTIMISSMRDPLPYKGGETFHGFGQRMADRAAERGY